MSQRFGSLVAVITLVVLGQPHASAQLRSGEPPVIFVHGMGSPADDLGVPGDDGAPGPFTSLLTRIADEYPRPGVCQRGAQTERPWDGSPCVFCYIEDSSEGHEGGAAAQGPNDSQSAVRPNADKLAREIAEVSSKAGRPVILIGYSMGGAIMRTYLARHRRDAERRVDAAILLHAVASGSWGYAFAGAVPRRAEGELGESLSELMRSLVASSSAVDLERPASQDLQPRSQLFRSIADKPLPRNVSYYTFWGDIRVVIGRQLLHYELPEFTMPPLGDLGLLPGDPDPRALPELGGQRFSPPVDAPDVALDIRHGVQIDLGSEVIGDLVASCRSKPTDPQHACGRLVQEHFDIPNTHMAIPLTLDRVMLDEPLLGGRVSMLEALIAAIGRHR